MIGKLYHRSENGWSLSLEWDDSQNACRLDFCEEGEEACPTLSLAGNMYDRNALVAMFASMGPQDMPMPDFGSIARQALGGMRRMIPADDE